MPKGHSIGINDNNYDSLKKGAANRGVSITGLANSIIEDLGVADKTEKVILSIPPSLTKRNKDELRKWLQVRIDAIMAAYYPE